ncbi:hypothetical protein Ddc_01095 [Ditylenchus destructor]|nr:hypothetical protein Ddc_01095 [Ditylenchus destructor]
MHSGIRRIFFVPSIKAASATLPTAENKNLLPLSPFPPTSPIRYSLSYLTIMKYFTLRVSAVLIILLALILLCDYPCEGRKAYKLKRGSRLERQHRRSLQDWRRGYFHRHHKKKKINKLKLEDILNKMDSFIRPRFGR